MSDGTTMHRSRRRLPIIVLVAVLGILAVAWGHPRGPAVGATLHPVVAEALSLSPLAQVGLAGSFLCMAACGLMIWHRSRT